MILLEWSVSKAFEACKRSKASVNIAGDVDTETAVKL